MHRSDSCIIHSNQPRDHSSLCIITLASFFLFFSSSIFCVFFCFYLTPLLLLSCFYSLAFVLLTRESAGGSSLLFLFFFFFACYSRQIRFGHQPVEQRSDLNEQNQFNRKEDVLREQLMPRFVFSRATLLETGNSFFKRSK